MCKYVKKAYFDLHLKCTAPISCLKYTTDNFCLDPEQSVKGWGENDRGISFTFGADVVTKFLNKHDFDLVCRAHQESFLLQYLS